MSKSIVNESKEHAMASDKLYWFARNGSALLANLITMPLYLVLFVLEAIRDGLVATFEADGSTQLDYPWQCEWPFFREDS